MNKIELSELNETKVLEILSVEKFNTVHPVRCSICNNIDSFKRRIFKIIGYIKNDELLESTVKSIISKNYDIESVFIKTINESLYADSSVCLKCSSTAIIYDIMFTEEMVNEFCKMFGTSKYEFLKGVSEIEKKIKLR